MQVSILCSGSKGNSTLVKGSKTILMIDCGAPTKKYLDQSLINEGVKPEAIDGLLITHTHCDHIKHLKNFASVPVYSYCSLPKITVRNKTVTFSHTKVWPRQSFQIGEFTITGVALSHDAGETMGFKIEGNGHVLVYITDTGYIKNSDIPFLSGADFYVFESNHDVAMLRSTSRPYSTQNRILGDLGHLNNQDSARALSAMLTPQTSHVVLAHLSQEANTPAKALEAFWEECLRKNIIVENLKVQTACQDQKTVIGQVLNDKKQ